MAGKMVFESEDERWAYNVEDCVRTREVGEVELSLIKKLGLEAPHEFQQRLFFSVLKTMNRGIRIDEVKRAALHHQLFEAVQDRMAYLRDICGHEVNPKSPTQLCKLFYEDLRQPLIMTRATRKVKAHPTVNDDALMTIGTREPLLKPIVNAIADLRTLGVFLSTFIKAPLDFDNRMRCSYNICGTDTYRLSSSKNAFGSGMNLQNIPSDKSKTAGKAAKRGSLDFTLPNIREMFIPDPGFTFFDMDLDRADLQVVVWETDDAMLKAALRIGADIHLLNVFVLDGQDPPPLEELVESHPKYAFHRGPRKLKREFAKVFCHATNYVGSARTVAAHTGRLVHEVDRAQRIWFGAHPGIKKWHEETHEQVMKRGFVENAFGFRWYIFDRKEAVLPQAVAWKPQSTVGIVINKAWINIDSHIPDVQVLLQVHDSLAGQIPTHRLSQLLPLLKHHAQIVVPYADPLIIPVGIKTSEKSWGECV